MKPLRHLVLLVLLLGSQYWILADTTNAINHVPLNPAVVTRIPVATDRLTTVRFPSPFSDLESALVTQEPHPDALFGLSYRTGQPIFSVRALAPAVQTTLNVVWNNQTYVLEFFESRNPWLSVIFDTPAGTVFSKVRPPSSRLLGILDTAKAFSLLKLHHPESTAGTEVVRPNTLHDYGRYSILTEEVFRFDAEDTLVFRIAVSNKTDTALQILPETLMVRTGTRVYYQSIAETPSSLPARTQIPIYFAITGSPDGTRNDLSPKNEFMVLLAVLDNAQAFSSSRAENAGRRPPGPISPQQAEPPTSSIVSPTISNPVNSLTSDSRPAGTGAVRVNPLLQTLQPLVESPGPRPSTNSVGPVLVFNASPNPNSHSTISYPATPQFAHRPSATGAMGQATQRPHVILYSHPSFGTNIVGARTNLMTAPSTRVPVRKRHRSCWQAFRDLWTDLFDL